MKITTTLRLEPPPEDRERLLSRLRVFNEACNWLSEIAFEEKRWNWLTLQRRAYRELRARFSLRSHEALVCIRKVASAYRHKRRRGKRAVFRPLGALALYRHRYKRDGTLAFYGFRIPFKARLGVVLSSDCEARLIWDGARFLVRQVLEIAEPEKMPAKEHLGVDLGIVQLAVDSDGTVYPEERHPFKGQHLRNLRRRHARLRTKLQKKGTKSAKRLLRTRRVKERRFASHVNHAIAKDVVAKAKRTLSGIGLEDLKGIRERIKASRPQRRELHSWAFGQLRAFIEYKARKEGVEVVVVDSRHTSQKCPKCGVIDKRNRPDRDLFKCVGCGCAGPADVIAAENIRRAARESAARGGVVGQP